MIGLNISEIEKYKISRVKKCFCMCNLCGNIFNPNLYDLNFLVGYDSLHMNLAGKFSYQKENQRTLSFNVDIQKLPEYKTVFTGSSSK